MSVALLVLTAIAMAAAILCRRAMDRAQESERRYRALAAHSPDLAVMLLDRSGVLEIFEGLALQRHGWTGGEAVGRHIAEIMPEGRFAELKPHLEGAGEGRPSSFEWLGVRSGTVFHVHALPFGERGQVMLAIRDIAAEHQLRTSLQRQSGFFSAVLTELGDQLSVSDAEGRMLAFDHDGGAPRPIEGDLHPLEWAEHFGLRHPDGTPLGPHETPLLRALRGERVRDIELRLGDRWLLASGGPVTAPDGTLLGAVTASADLTAHRDAEDRLRLSEERHRRVVESMDDCVFESDHAGNWTYLSEAWFNGTGLTVEESLGRSSWEFVHPADRTDHARAFAPLLRGEQAAARLRHRFLTVDGAERWVDVQARAISGWDGLPTGFTGVMRDVTDEQRARQHTTAEQSVVRLLAEANGLDDVGPGLVEALCRDLGWDAAELWRMGDDEHLRRTAAWGPGLETFLAAGAQRAFEVGDGLPGQAWMSRQPLWREGDARGPQRSVEARIRSTVALALRGERGPHGVVTLVSRIPREPEPGLTRLLETIGAHVHTFLQRREAEQRAADRAADLKAISGVAHELASHTDLYAARTTLTAAVRDITRAACVILWEPVAGEEELEVTAASGAAIRGMRLPLAERSVTGSAFLTGDFEFTPDMAADERVSDRWRAVTSAGSSAWVPVIHDGRTVGVLAVGWEKPRAVLPERDEELLRLLSAEAAVTIHRTDLLARLQSSARTDALTGLPNRRVWDEDLEREISRARRHGGVLCLAMLDLDRFKAFNDHWGHQAGDELLASSAAAWRPLLRATDTIARYGGEEFAVLLPHSDQEGALAVVERLLAAVPLGQSASAGLAVWDGQEAATALLARADAALYEAKRAGRARAMLAV